MRLAELKSPEPAFHDIAKKLDFYRQEEYFGVGGVLKNLREIMERNGFSLVGRGEFGAVFEHPSRDYLLKVSVSHDTAYTAFANFAADHPDNPHFPRIMKRPMLYRQNLVFTGIERLQPCDIASFDAFDRAAALVLSQMGLRRLPKWQGYEDEIERYLARFPKLADALKACMTLGVLDISHRNVMLRGGVPVLVDPVAP